MIIADALKDISRLYIETAPIIYYTESRVGYVDKMRAILQVVIAQNIIVITNAVTVTESLMKPLQNKDMPLVNRYQALFFNTQNIQTISVTPHAGEKAAQLRASYGLKTPDALHVASALDAGCDAFLTNDIGLRRINEISILILDELEET